MKYMMQIERISMIDIKKVFECLKEKRKSICIEGNEINLRTNCLKFIRKYCVETNNKPVCSICGREATHFQIDNGKLHLYSGNVLMNKDHIIPKGKGGIDSFVNLQLTCYDCNHKKANNLIVNSERIIKKQNYYIKSDCLKKLKTNKERLLNVYKKYCNKDISNFDLQKQKTIKQQLDIVNSIFCHIEYDNTEKSFENLLLKYFLEKKMYIER